MLINLLHLPHYDYEFIGAMDLSTIITMISLTKKKKKTIIYHDWRSHPALILMGQSESLALVSCT